MRFLLCIRNPKYKEWNKGQIIAVRTFQMGRGIREKDLKGKNGNRAFQMALVSLV